MAYSMTGYANENVKTEFSNMQIEIRSLNHRFFDLNIKVPDELKFLESTIREIVSHKISRGKVEVRINFKDQSDNAIALEINQKNLFQYKNIMDQIVAIYPDINKPSIIEIINLPGIIGSNQRDDENLKNAVATALKSVVDKLIDAQKKEGDRLVLAVLDKLSQMAVITKKLRSVVDVSLNAYRLKLHNKILDIAKNIEDIDQQRFQQEIAYFCQKADVDEEITRLQSHIHQSIQLLNTQSIVGKQLDFLTQEMHRETNTFNAKSISLEATNHGMDIKILIEQIKEQIQNIM